MYRAVGIDTAGFQARYCPCNRVSAIALLYYVCYSTTSASGSTRESKKVYFYHRVGGIIAGAIMLSVSSVCPSIRPSVRPFVHTSVHLSVHLSICPSVCALSQSVSHAQAFAFLVFFSSQSSLCHSRCTILQESYNNIHSHEIMLHPRNTIIRLQNIIFMLR